MEEDDTAVATGSCGVLDEAEEEEAEEEEEDAGAGADAGAAGDGFDSFIRPSLICFSVYVCGKENQFRLLRVKAFKYFLKYINIYIKHFFLTFPLPQRSHRHRLA